jgi:DNA-binding MarR family transcriptional regulator
MSSQPSDMDSEANYQASLELGRKLSAATVLFHAAVADRLGLNVTDLKCWDQLVLSGPVTAGHLAEITGLTTGAITGVIDRLEKSRYARRERDSTDRRVVMVYPLLENEAQVGQLYAPLGRAMAVLMQQYAPEEVRLFIGLVERTVEVLQQETLRLRRDIPSHG